MQKQKTTEDFAYGLNQSVAAHPLAPPTSFGRVTWLKRQLQAYSGETISLNTVHRWLTGASRPREDRIRSCSYAER
jgi:hypothetical protein